MTATEAEQGHYHPVETIAAVLHVSPRRVQQLVAAGIIPRAERGRYRLDECIAGYVRHLQRALDDTDKPGAPDAR